MNLYNKRNVIEIAPGLFLCIIIGYIGKYIGSFIPKIGGGFITIFLGIIVGNLLKKECIYEKGSKFSENIILSLSIVFLGGTLHFDILQRLGLSGVGFIILQMSITIIGALWIGKKLMFSYSFCCLMASGNAVCGSSAIAATTSTVGASPEEKAISITIVNLTGTLLMLLLPFISNLFFSLDVSKTSAMIGGVLQSVGQVITSGSLVNEKVKDLATVYKMIRILFLVIVVLLFAKMKNSVTSEKISSPKIKIPWYLIGFVFLFVLYNIDIIPKSLSNVFKIISSHLEITALAGIGMRVKVPLLINQGFQSMLYSLLISILQIGSSIILITLLIQ